MGVARAPVARLIGGRGAADHGGMNGSIESARGAATTPVPIAAARAAAQCRRLTPWLVGPVLFVSSMIAWFEEHGTVGLGGAMLRNAVVWLLGVGGFVAAASLVLGALLPAVAPGDDVAARGGTAPAR